jgi:heme a synthase
VKSFRGFALAAAGLAFVLVVLGSWVRINGAGMTCPDWPLCRGSLIPSLQGGVVLEWSHRLVVLIETFVIFGLIVAGVRVRKEIAGLGPALVTLAIVFATQVGLGGVTIFRANDPLSVVLHWGTAMLLLATLTWLAVLSILTPDPDAIHQPHPATSYAAPALAIAAFFAFVTMCAGAFVSSSYDGLACTTVPLCNGAPFGSNAAQYAQMFHRTAGYTFAVVAIVAFLAARGSSRRVVTFAGVGLALICLQITLGFANVLGHLPIVLREAHAANAGLTFLAFVIAALLASLEPYTVTSHGRERPRVGRVVSA